ncbi:hypothetical protein A0J11_12680 [Listeria monocytogenes]|uniref:Uncharacterized protein n=1 Tax=Listeria innocua ATCC 33091 TaxID=1002366 RepID=A0AB72ZBJ9_LISIO|nr:hypothetical protein ID18_11955 [Listeria monocytogenes]EHN62246.1 hypothetical protein HMPREF0557_00801 [Listeria innocua ATCC 33091]ATL55400.1 hypothetical protein CRD58_12780 [Listeria monocytogenes]AVK45976.1 hypothetical protein CA173_12475 [Listeria monocytogenes]OYN60713.1 hypothetical protein AP300_014145 [Listeria monocytogenes]
MEVIILDYEKANLSLELIKAMLEHNARINNTIGQTSIGSTEVSAEKVAKDFLHLYEALPK